MKPCTILLIANIRNFKILEKTREMKTIVCCHCKSDCIQYGNRKQIMEISDGTFNFNTSQKLAEQAKKFLGKDL